MNKLLTLLILAITSFSSYGQGKSKETPALNFRRIQIGINVSPDICFRTLKNNDGSSSSDHIIQLNNENETVKIGYTAGLNICFNIKNSVGLETGIQYSNKGYQTKFRNLILIQPDPNSPYKAKFIYNMHYIDIPVKANFTYGDKKVRFFTSAGITTNIFIKATSTSVLIYSDRIDRKTTPVNTKIKKVNISPTLSVGIDYKINSRMSLRVEPTFRYGVLKTTDTPVTDYLYSSGINIGYYLVL
ncbi:MAG: PorT family protein [Bacteroidia bacterium]|nr:PorT family protein [Bacteroidia bacterium]